MKGIIFAKIWRKCKNKRNCHKKIEEISIGKKNDRNSFPCYIIKWKILNENYSEFFENIYPQNIGIKRIKPENK